VETYLESGEAGPIEKENLVEFHLLYQGPLHSQRAENVRNEKHQIRKALHRQLKRLWQTNPNLQRAAKTRGDVEHTEHFARTGGTGSSPPITENEKFQWGVEYLAKTWERNGFHFLPLVTPDMFLRCSLEILFLRMEERDYVLQGGDIDGRIHVLFDGLRMFRDGNDLPSRNATPDPDEKPFFCLLQDDTLVSDVKIDTGGLLLLPNQEQANKHDVYLQITVRLNPTQPNTWSWVF